MKRRLLVVLLIALVCFGGMALDGFKSLRPPDPNASPPATALKRYKQPAIFRHALNPVLIGPDVYVEHTFRVRNETKTALVVDRVSKTCSCTQAILGEKNLAPNESTTLSMIVSMAARNRRSDVGCMLGFSDGSESLYQLTVEGVTALDVEPKMLRFSAKESQKLTRQFRIVVHEQQQTIGALEVESDSPDIVVSIAG